jgi:hypothetical protein
MDVGPVQHEQATFYIEVDVALRRPPRVDATTYHVIATDRGEVDAHLTAIYMATATRPTTGNRARKKMRFDREPSAGVVMAVGCRTVYVEI